LERAKVGGRRLAPGYQLLRVFVADLVEREAAAARDIERRSEEPRGMNACEAADGAQVAFAVRMELAADFRERALQPDRAHHVLEALARALVHVRIARGNAWEMHALAERFELGDA